MTRDEYERHLRRLEEQLRVGIELLQASYRHQVGAVELIWRMTNGEGVPVPSLPAETVAAPQAQQQAVRPPAAPARPPRLEAGALYYDIVEALPKLPEVFDTRELREALGYAPHRGSLHRALQELEGKGLLAVEFLGRGKMPSSYRQTGVGPSV